MVQEHIEILTYNVKNVLNHIKYSKAAFTKFRKNAYDFPRGKNTIRTDQINFPLWKFLKIRYDFPGHHTPRADILLNCLVGCLRIYPENYNLLITFQQFCKKIHLAT